MSRVGNKMFKELTSSRILRQVSRINQIHGDSSNAYVFNNVKKFELIFPVNRSYMESYGIRQFWKYNLPVFKFHNDDIDFIIKKVQTTDAELEKCPVKLVIHEDSQTKEIDCKNLEPSSILSQLLEITNAEPVPSSTLESLTLKPKASYIKN